MDGISISWLCLSEAEIERAEKLIAAFKGEDAADSLGLRPLNDLFSDWLYPGLTIPMNLNGAPAEMSRQRIEAFARRSVLRRLREAKVAVGTGVTRPWQVTAWLSQGKGDVPESADALRRRARRSELPLNDFARRYTAWSHEAEGEAASLRVSKSVVAQLVRIALYSPANCLYRSFLRTFGEETTKEVYPDLVVFSLTQFRAYWNRATTQAIVNRQPRRRTYSERSLEYCAVHQLEAVLDEYVYLLASYSGHDGGSANSRNVRCSANSSRTRSSSPRPSREAVNRFANRRRAFIPDPPPSPR